MAISYMKETLINKLSKNQLRDVAKNLEVVNTDKMNLPHLFEVLEPFSYQQIVNSLNK